MACTAQVRIDIEPFFIFAREVWGNPISGTFSSFESPPYEIPKKVSGDFSGPLTVPEGLCRGPKRLSRGLNVWDAKGP